MITNIHSHRLSEQEIDKIFDFLENKIKFECNLCKNTRFSMCDKIYRTDALDNGEITRPIVSFMCEECTHTICFSAKLLFDKAGINRLW